MPGGGVILKFDVLPHCFAVFWTVCMQAMTHSVGNVQSQQAVKLVVVGPSFVEQCWFGLFLGDQWQWKMGWIGDMTLQSVTLTLKFSLIFQTNEEISLLLPSRQTSIKWKLVFSRMFPVLFLVINGAIMTSLLLLRIIYLLPNFFDFVRDLTI